MQRTVTYQDEFTITQIADSLHVLMDAIKKCDEVIVDTKDVKKIDVAAVQMLIAAQKECEKNGQRIIFRKSGSVSQLLSHIGTRL